MNQFNQSDTIHNLQGQHILLTGPENEIGYHLSVDLAKRGAQLIWLVKKSKYVHPLYDVIVEQGAPAPLIVEFDRYRANEEGFNLLATELQNQITQLHAIVHCELNLNAITPVMNSTHQQWQDCYRDYFFIVFALTRALLPLLQNATRQHENACVIFTLLNSALKGDAFFGPIGCAQSAIVQLQKTLHQETSHLGMRYNSLCIDDVATSMARHLYPARIQLPPIAADSDILLGAYRKLLTQQNLSNQVIRDLLD